MKFYGTLEGSSLYTKLHQVYVRSKIADVIGSADAFTAVVVKIDKGLTIYEAIYHERGS